MISNHRKGFFINFLLKIAKTIENNIQMNCIFGVKHLKKILGIPKNDRSLTAFTSKSLDKMVKMRILEFTGKSTTKKYKKILQITSVMILERLSCLKNF